MSYKALTTQTMVAISSAWLDETQERPLIESLAQSRGLLPSIEKAHKGLLWMQEAGAKTATDLTALQNEQAQIDDVHDRKARGLFHVLTGFADLTDDPQMANDLNELRERIYPQALRVVQWTYLDEAGEAALVEKRLRPEDLALLEKLPSVSGTLFEEHRARVLAGKKLGELEKQKSLMAASGNDGISAGDVLRARNTWIRTVTAFVAIALLDELSEEDERKLFGPLREAERKADRKGGEGA